MLHRLFRCRWLRATLVAAWATTVGFVAHEAFARRPNVILVNTDDQGYGDLSCHGNPYLKTPALDRLYEESIRLTDFHVDPTCSPTRSALMTGRYSSRVGVWHTIMGRSLLREDEVTMADVFNAAGYRTAIFGKWHLGDNFPYRPTDRGFEEALVNGGGGITQGPDYWGNTYFSPTLLHNDEWEPSDGYCTDVFFSAAIRFIEQHQDEPFFVYLPPNAAHAPYQVDEKYKKPFLEMGLKDPTASFFGMIVNIDENMAKLVAKLDELGLAEDTILVFMTDNGTAAGNYNAGMRGKKGSQYDGGHRVPCFLRWKGHWQGGRDIDRLTAHLDLLPTFIDVCDLPKPAGVKFDGKSLRPLIEEKNPEWPDRTIIVSVNRMDHPEPWVRTSTMTEKYRLIDGKELYDIDADPGQEHDIAAEHPDIVAKLRKDYEEWYADVSRRYDEYVPIYLGSPAQNPTVLCSHDWHGPNVPWAQVHMERRIVANGFWAVKVDRPGKYRITLRDRPPYVDEPLLGTKARLQVGDFEAEKPIPENVPGVSFEAVLPAGETRLQTWITQADGKTRGCYFVVVEYLGE
ncbi:arylsulfatase [Thermostilla marina]